MYQDKSRPRLKVIRSRADNKAMEAFSTDKGTSHRCNEGGFTLPELLVVLAIIGILAAIAVPTWQNLTQQRQLDSATNQLVSDLRRANTLAANRLGDYVVILPPKNASNSNSYQIGPSGGALDTKTFPDGTQTNNGAQVTVTFGSDGMASVAPAGQAITISSSSDTSKTSTIDLNTETSRVRIAP